MGLELYEKIGRRLRLRTFFKGGYAARLLRCAVPEPPKHALNGNCR